MFSKKHYPEIVKIGNNRDCVIQSWLSAWVVRDFIAWLRDLQSETFVYLAARRKGPTCIIDLSDEYIFGYVQRVFTSAEVLFFPQKTQPLLLAR